MNYILIIEDDQPTGRMLSAVLEPLGHPVIVSNNAFDGIRIAQENTPILILMDIRLPGMNGWEAIHILRNDPQLWQVPIFALTAQTHAEDMQRAIEAGCNEYLSKPFNLQVLTNLIRKYTEATH